jgi:predicted signal transduction protein with EAL and GGDEF domain
LVVARNEPLVRAEAVLSALRQTAIVLFQVLATAALLYFFFRRNVVRPLGRFARDMTRIKPGSGERLVIPPEHEFDEIGALSTQVNDLLTQAEAALSEVQELAVTDSLTGLGNRRAFLQQISGELERIKRYDTPTASVLMLDLDHFKNINDEYGHAAGDAVLVRLGSLMREEMRKVDVAGRLGGEEFALRWSPESRQNCPEFKLCT